MNRFLLRGLLASFAVALPVHAGGHIGVHLGLPGISLRVGGPHVGIYLPGLFVTSPWKCARPHRVSSGAPPVVRSQMHSATRAGVAFTEYRGPFPSHIAPPFSP